MSALRQRGAGVQAETAKPEQLGVRGLEHGLPEHRGGTWMHAEPGIGDAAAVRAGNGREREARASDISEVGKGGLVALVDGPGADPGLQYPVGKSPAKALCPGDAEGEL